MDLKNSIEKVLGLHFNAPIKVLKYSSVGGGSINDAYKVETGSDIFFVKTNSLSRFPQMFEKEAKGLRILEKANCINVPELLCFSSIGDTSFLVLKYVERGYETKGFWDGFAHGLANLHKSTTKHFGLDHHNYIGSLLQYNDQKDSWSDFFIEQRLEIQLKMAVDSGSIDKLTVDGFNNFYKRIDDIFPKEPPALIHGDLWSGNFMVDESSNAVIIDPAVYYGHREMDLAMSMLFGGFSRQFYDSYNKYYPLEKGWQQRMEYCNLYPLLVHVNLFGGSYSNSVKSIISRF
jgi:fructosamine-3-kinase